MPTDETKYTLTGAVVAAALGLLAKLITSFVGLWKARNQKYLENAASLEEIRNKGIVELLNDYRVQVASLKTELLAQATRHAQAIQAATERYDALEAEHYRVMEELATVKTELASLRMRLDGE